MMLRNHTIECRAHMYGMTLGQSEEPECICKPATPLDDLKRQARDAETPDELVRILMAAQDLARRDAQFVRHFPFGRERTLYCDCGWHMDNATKVHWWMHVLEDVPTEAEEPLLSDNVLSALRSHAFPTCEVCGSMVDDPEALERCSVPADRPRS